MNTRSLSPALSRLVAFLAQGLSYREIAEELGVSIKTIEGHRRALGLYFNSDSRADIVRRAAEAGLIDAVPTAARPAAAAPAAKRDTIESLRTELAALRERLADAEGEGCTLHGDAPHGSEAEELRAGLETLLKHGADGEHQPLVVARSALYDLLDRVQARDSLSYLRANERIAELDAELAATRLATCMASPDAVLTAAERILRDELINRVSITSTLGVFVTNCLERRIHGYTLPEAVANLKSSARDDGEGS